MKKQECIFCNIIKGTIPCFKIAENEQAIAFLDIANDSYGHTLVIPKKHCKNILDCDESSLVAVQKLVQEVAKHYVEDCGFNGVNIFCANEECAGQTVFHLHYHIFPRKKKDKLKIEFSCEDKIPTLEEVHKKLAITEAEKQIKAKSVVVLYTDGACSNNPGIGGYCSILQYNGREKIISGGEAETTNNRMELMGVLKGLQAIKAKTKVEVYSDSAYVINAFEQRWLDSWQKNNWKTSGKSPVLNLDLWKALLVETERLDIKWCKVKGHADNELNNRCDEIARSEVAKIKALKGE